MKLKRTLIACSIFQEELEYLLGLEEAYEVDYIWLNASYHNDLTLLENKLTEVINGHSQKRGSSLRLLYGQGCLPDMPDLAKRYQVPLLRAKNCLAAMVGEERLLELEQNRTMVITPSWIRKMWGGESGLQVVLGWSEVDFRINFGRYDRIVVLEAGLQPLTDEEILTCFDLIQVPIEIEPCNLNYFQKLLRDLLA